MSWWAKLVIGYFGLFFVVIVSALAITETVELLIGKNERDVGRSASWLRRVNRLKDALHGAWTLGLAWVFSVSLLNTLGVHDLPTAGDRWRLLQAVGVLFGAWSVASIIWNGLRARHSERIDMVINGRRF